MIEPEALSALQETFGARPPVARADRCLNARHKDAGCTRCVDACPTGAIALDGGRPGLAADRCVHCGVCIHACPTDVFGQRDAPERILIQTLSHLPDRPLELVCPLLPRPDVTPAPVAGVVRHGRCLAALAPEQLLALSDNGARPLWLNDSLCARCPIGAVQSQIPRSVETANRLLEALGRSGAAALPSADADRLLAEPVHRPLLDGMKPRFSRRDFFGALGQMARTRVTEALEERPDPTPGRAVPVEKRLPHRLPESRRRLLARLEPIARTLDEPGAPDAHSIPAAGLPFAPVLVDGDACSGCGLCARFCPTGALTFSGEVLSIRKPDDAPEPFTLSFRPSLCIDCGICAVACPDDAVTFGETLTGADLLPETERALVGGELVACASCGAATAPRPGDAEALCYVCRQKPNAGRSLWDDADRFADVLKGR